MAVIGAGFCGLAAAYELGRHGIRATVLERDDGIGGLAGSFDVAGVRLEKFYHHWFTSDAHVMALIRELGRQDEVLLRPTRTGMYFGHRFYRLSSPLDLLRFSPLPLADRLRLGLLALRARRVRDWRALEGLTAAQWLRALGGDRVYRVVWEPLLRGKFGAAADEVSAVWFWNKIKLRGGSRGRRGTENLAYYRGGFAALADALADAIRRQGGSVHTGRAVTGLAVDDGRVTAVGTGQGSVAVDAVIATAALPVVADLVRPHVPGDYVAALGRIAYLANVCVVLVLRRSLSDTYWLNVNDPGFPFVGVIEHTNFEPHATYDGRHIVYASKYLPESDPLFAMADPDLVDFTLRHLQRMFPELTRDWVIDAHVWRARHSQPIVTRRYSELIPSAVTPLRGFYLATMAQIYPQDRGTNYAVGAGRAIATLVREQCSARSNA